MKMRWLFLIGLLVLIALGLVFMWRDYWGAISGRSPQESPPPDLDTVVCYGRVDIEGSVVSLVPVKPSRVTQVCVEENSEVEAGALLLRMDAELAKLRLQEAEIAVSVADDRLTEAQAQGERHALLVRQQQNAIRAARHRWKASEFAYRKKKRLLNKDLTDTEEVSAEEEQMRALQALEEVEVARLAELQTHDPQRAVRQAKLEQEAAKNRKAQACQLLAECELRAPEAGTVLRLLAAPGDVVGTPSKSVAAWFAPRLPYRVRAEIDQEFASQVVVGLPATIAEEDAEGITWIGRVLRIARWVYPRRTIVTDPFVMNDTRTVECLISIDRQHPPLRIGQRMRVHIKLREH